MMFTFELRYNSSIGFSKLLLRSMKLKYMAIDIENVYLFMFCI